MEHLYLNTSIIKAHNNVIVFCCGLLLFLKPLKCLYEKSEKKLLANLSTQTLSAIPCFKKQNTCSSEV